MDPLPDSPLVAISVWGVSAGAMATIAANLAKGFLEHGCEVDVVRVDRKPPSPILGFPDSVRHFCLEGRSSTSVFRLARYLKENKPDVLIAIAWTQNAPAILAKILTPTFSGVLLLSEQSTLSYKARVEHRRHLLLSRMAWFAGRFYGRADAVVAVSDEVRRDLAALGVPADTPLVTISNPVDGIRILELSRETLPADLVAIAASRPLFAAVGRLAEQKDHRLLIDAFSIVRSEMGSGTLVIAGEGPLRRELEEQIRALGLEASVHLVGFKPNPFPLVAVADAFVLSSREEGFGLVLVEAMAIGVPIVAGECPGGVSEVLESGDAGLLVAPHDVRALADGMKKVLSDHDLRRRIVQRGVKRSKDFAPDTIAGRWLEVVNWVRH